MGQAGEVTQRLIVSVCREILTFTDFTIYIWQFVTKIISQMVMIVFIREGLEWIRVDEHY